MKSAFLYGRFSTERQGQEKRDSKDRQLRTGRAFAERHEIKLKGIFFDEGVSSKAGKNLEKEFAKMLSALKEGDGIITEDLDRVSRMHPWLIKAKIYEILADGHFIGTHLGGDKIYTLENIEEAETFLVGDIRSGVAYIENVKKRHRQRQRMLAYENDIIAGKKVLGFRIPSWLSFKDDAFHPIPEKVKTLKRIFTLADKEIGSVAITKKLIAEGEPVLTNLRRKKTKWNDAYVRHILRSKLPIGTFTFRDKEYPDYYPRIIKQEQWDRVQHKIAVWTAPKGRPAKQNNLFAGFLKCGVCGSSINLVGGHGTFRHYVCEKARLGDGCKFKGWRKDYLENIFLENLIHSEDFMRSLGEDKGDTLSEFYGKRDTLKKDIERLTDIILESGETKALVARQRSMEQHLEALEVSINDEEIRLKSTAPDKDTHSSIIKLIKEGLEDPSNRVKVRQGLQSMFKVIYLTPSESKISVHLRNTPYIHCVKFSNLKGEHPEETRIHQDTNLKETFFNH
jgi:DNA invertase Pin-like site-specific DNA recombinase